MSESSHGANLISGPTNSDRSLTHAAGTTMAPSREETELFEHMYQSQRETARAILHKGKTRRQMELATVELAMNAGKALDRLIATTNRVHALRGDTPVACRAGCSWCCYLQVTASPIEVFRIVKALRKQLSADEIGELRARVRAVDQRTHRLNAADRLRSRIACPLLDNGRCLVYADRPLACRGWTSYDAEDCRRAVEDGDIKVIVKPDNLPRLGASAVSKGVETEIDNANFDGRPVELVAALRIVLEEPDSMKRWLKGQLVFANARWFG